MKNKFKILLYYIIEFILSIIVLISVLLLIFKFTIFNNNYLIKQLEKNNYYDVLDLSIKEDMKNYIIQSGLENRVLENIYDKALLKKEVNKLVKTFYSNQKYEVNLDIVKINLENNITSYLKENNLEITDQESLDLFTEEILKIYKNKIQTFGDISNVQILFNKINNCVVISVIILIFVIFIITLLVKFYFKKNVLFIPFLTSIILLLIGNYLFFERVDVSNILFWNTNVSELIKSILYDISSIIIVFSIIIIIYQFVFIVFLFFWEKIFRKK